MDYEPAIQENEGRVVPKGGQSATCLLRKVIALAMTRARMVLKRDQSHGVLWRGENLIAIVRNL